MTNTISKFVVNLVLFLFICFFVITFCRKDGGPNSDINEKISYLIKIREIDENFTDNESNFFMNIDSLCCDDDNNLYVADSGWKKIFKFDSDGNYLFAFGREGEGQGEFLVQPKRYPLKASFGNDKNIYVTDSRTKRATIFSKKGQFIKHFYLPSGLHGSVLASSKGDIYLFSKNKENAIDCYDKNFNFKTSILDRGLHFKYPYYKPKWYKNDKLQIMNYADFQKIITKKDHLIFLSNYSLTAFYFDEGYNLLNSFMIKNKIFLKDFKKRLRKAVSRGGFISPFYACLDDKGNLCLLYYNNSIQNNEIYRYKTDGMFLDILRFPRKTKKSIRILDYIAFDGLANIYASINRNKIGIYRINY